MPNWTIEQRQAIDLDHSNIIVSAGAGSGKTEVLSERVIRKLKDGVHINELLILTFTNAAARGMKNRIRKNIIFVIGPIIYISLNIFIVFFIVVFQFL